MMLIQYFRQCPPSYVCINDTHSNPNSNFTHFDNFGTALLCTFRLMTQDYWENLYQIVSIFFELFNLMINFSIKIYIAGRCWSCSIILGLYDFNGKSKSIHGISASFCKKLDPSLKLKVFFKSSVNSRVTYSEVTVWISKLDILLETDDFIDCRHFEKEPLGDSPTFSNANYIMYNL